jgi:hypothetical protein
VVVREDQDQQAAEDQVVLAAAAVLTLAVETQVMPEDIHHRKVKQVVQTSEAAEELAATVVH